MSSSHENYNFFFENRKTTNHRFSDSMIMFQIASDILREMAMPLVVSGVNLVLPFVFSLLARIESYEKPKNELYINMLRYV